MVPVIVEDTTRDRVRFADAGNGIEIAYETFGNPSDPTILLVMGLGMQMLAWDEGFCELLVDRGYHVVRYDNRDIGLSTKVGGGVPNILAGAVGLTGSARYTLREMTQDAVGLLDHLEVERAHVVGASMGGMIAQTLAARHSERVLSLCSIMSSAGGRKPAVMPRMSVIGTLLAKPPSEREAYASHVAKIFTRIGSTGFDPDYERLRERSLLMYDRSFYPAGGARQLMAIMASGDRTRELREIHCPTLVIHGLADKLIPAGAGEAVARAIPGARFEPIEGMGHDLPAALWPRITGSIAHNAERAKPEQASAAPAASRA
jgi:pimeloyl-ACP methyl ester carboxylesterase